MHTHVLAQWPAGEAAVPPAPGAVQIGISVEPAVEVVTKEGSKQAARWARGGWGVGGGAHTALGGGMLPHRTCCKGAPRAGASGPARVHGSTPAPVHVCRENFARGVAVDLFKFLGSFQQNAFGDQVRACAQRRAAARAPHSQAPLALGPSAPLSRILEQASPQCRACLLLTAPQIVVPSDALNRWAHWGGGGGSACTPQGVGQVLLLPRPVTCDAGPACKCAARALRASARRARTARRRWFLRFQEKSRKDPDYIFRTKDE